MPDFIVSVLHKGKTQKISLVADNAIEARKMAKRHGRVLTVKKSSALTGLFSRSMNAAERIVFLQRLATMVGSRVAMGEALNIMKSAFTGPVRRVSDELYRKVESGADFGDALSSMRRDFPETTAALIRSGIRGGNLERALRNAADFELEMDHIKRDSSKGLWGAIGSFLLAAAMIIGTAWFVGPYVMESDLIQAAGDSVEVEWVFMVAHVTAGLMGVITAGFVGLLLLAYVVKPVIPRIADKAILRIPIFRDLVLARNHYTVFYGLGLLIHSGVRMEDALNLAAESAPPGEVAADLRRAHGAVRAGKPWATSMHNLHPTDIAALSTSQDKEQIAKALDAVAKQHRDTYTQRIQEVVPGLQLLAAFFMSLGGALLFGMIILPMLQMTQGLL